MGIVDRHADLRAIGLAQHGGKQQRMFLDFAVLENPPLDKAVSKLVDPRNSARLSMVPRVVLSTFETVGTSS
jgi:hypothetical protein